MVDNQILVPPLKWAGGKRWFAHQYAHLLPSAFNQYVEPFLGSAAMFFSVRPTSAVLSDTNFDLINLYSTIRAHPDVLQEKLKKHHERHSKEYYYEVRSSAPTSCTGQAARFLYLNRTCWNGLYRVNARGQFNVPIGTKSSVVMETDDFHSLSASLQNVTLLCTDFESVIDAARSGDFVFVDPPYTIAHNYNGFIKYNEVLFSWDDQIRLKDAVERAVRRKVKVLVTNAAHQSIRDLYGSYEQILVSRAGVIAGKSGARGRFEETVIRCY